MCRRCCLRLRSAVWSRSHWRFRSQARCSGFRLRSRNGCRSGRHGSDNRLPQGKDSFAAFVGHLAVSGVGGAIEGVHIQAALCGTVAVHHGNGK